MSAATASPSRCFDHGGFAVNLLQSGGMADPLFPHGRRGCAPHPLIARLPVRESLLHVAPLRVRVAVLESPHCFYRLDLGDFVPTATVDLAPWPLEHEWRLAAHHFLV